MILDSFIIKHEPKLAFPRSSNSQQIASQVRAVFLQHQPSTCLILFVYGKFGDLGNGINSQETGLMC